MSAITPSLGAVLASFFNDYLKLQRIIRAPRIGQQLGMPAT